MTAVAHSSAGRSSHPSGLAEVLDIVLDKGIVIDAYVRVALVGIEILTIDARVVIASVDTYLRFAEAVNRLDLQPQEQAKGLPGLIGDLQEGGAKHKTRGALSGVTESARDMVSSLRSDDDDEDDDSREAEPAPRRSRPRKAAPAAKRQRPSRRGDEDEG
jgi:hypothetical protein